MFLKIFLFEIRYRLRRPATYAYFAILFLFAFLTAAFGGLNVSEKTYVNSAFVIARLTIIISIFEMLIASAIMGVPVYRDIEYKTKDYFFTYPISEGGYFMGRYLGSFLILILISFGVHLGYIAGSPLGILTGEVDRKDSAHLYCGITRTTFWCSPYQTFCSPERHSFAS